MFTGELQSIHGILHDTRTSTQGPQFELGRRIATKDGRVYRYARAGASDLVVGNILQSAAPVANHLALTPSAAAIGALEVTLTLGATAADENQYAGGYLQVDTTPGNGYMYLVDSHAAIASAGSGTIKLDKTNPIVIALTSSSRVGLIQNPWYKVIQVPTTKTAMICGGAISVIPASGYGWVQTWGPFAALINGTPAVTAPVINGATTAGTVDVWTAAAQPTATMVGQMMQVGVSTKNNAIFLMIAP